MFTQDIVSPSQHPNRETVLQMITQLPTFDSLSIMLPAGARVKRIRRDRVVPHKWEGFTTTKEAIFTIYDVWNSEGFAPNDPQEGHRIITFEIPDPTYDLVSVDWGYIILDNVGEWMRRFSSRDRVWHAIWKYCRMNCSSARVRYPHLLQPSHVGTVTAQPSRGSAATASLP